MPTETVTTLISASDLKRQRGWTEGLINTLLGPPDALAPNPHGFRPPMRFYAEDRVLDAEGAEEFTSWAGRLDEHRAWRRTMPTRCRAACDIEHLEWLDDPRKLRLFLTPRTPRRRRRRAPEAPPTQPVVRFEVLRLFEMPPEPVSAPRA